MSDIVLERIAAWEAAGLIDAATAERLRAAEAEAVPEPRRHRPTAAPRAGVASSFFGPAGLARRDVLVPRRRLRPGGWGALITRLVGEASERRATGSSSPGIAVPAAGLLHPRVAFNGRSARLSRAAGVCFLLSVAWS